jgi:transposase
VTTPSDPLPTDLAAAHAVILAQREMLTIARSEVTVGRLEIERLAKAQREQFGQSSERGKRLVEQLELAIEDLEETQAEVETKAEMAAPEAAKEKRARAARPARKPPPDNLPVERIVEPPPCACGKCGGVRLRKLGEVVSKTLECEPRRWKIIEHVREKFSCRDCEAITEPPAPSHPIPRGFAGPSLLAMVLVAKFLLHQPLNRQSETYAREGIELDVSTPADRVGACVVALDPIIQALWAHVLSAERIHADDTTVPVLAKTVTGRIWTHVRDDRPFGGKDPPAAVFRYSRTPAGEHPQAHSKSKTMSGQPRQLLRAGGRRQELAAVRLELRRRRSKPPGHQEWRTAAIVPRRILLATAPIATILSRRLSLSTAVVCCVLATMQSVSRQDPVPARLEKVIINLGLTSGEALTATPDVANRQQLGSK